MNVLIIGSGAREHALALAIARSPRLARLYVAPGNPGAAQVAETVAIDVADHGAVVDFCRLFAIGLVVVGPEAPLVAGIADDLAAAGILCFGPGRAAAQLEGSKGFTKDFCREFGIPTAAYGRFDRLDAALAFLRAKGAPIVVKADGLASGKGVVVATTLEEAEEALRGIFAGRFGAAGAEVVVEDVLPGEEVSFFALSDGARAIPFGAAQDHKRVGDGDTGPNTGGMGAYSPPPAMTPAMSERVMREIIDPTVAGLAARGAPFRGVLFAGLMIGPDGPKLIEYNVRFGDPEAEVLLARLEDDLLALMLACAKGALPAAPARFSDSAALTVVLATRGYPGAVATGSEIGGVEAAGGLPGVTIHYAAARRDGARLVAAGGRVLAVTATGADLAQARARAYAAVDAIDWPEGFCRRDIGWRAIPRRPAS
jgi:phosphoribosylamine--glycine ligase